MVAVWELRAKIGQGFTLLTSTGELVSKVKGSDLSMLTWQVIEWLLIGCGWKGDAVDDGGGGSGGGKGDFNLMDY